MSRSILPPWGVIAIVFTLGAFWLIAGNADRLFHTLAQSKGTPVAGVVVSTRSYLPEGNTYKTYAPTVRFADGSGVIREMEVRRPSIYYGYPRGTAVVVLWSSASERVAIQRAFQRKFGVNITLWTFTAIGAILIAAALWLVIRRQYLGAMLRRRKARKQHKRAATKSGAN